MRATCWAVSCLVCLPRVRRCSQLLCPRAAAPPPVPSMAMAARVHRVRAASSCGWALTGRRSSSNCGSGAKQLACRRHRRCFTSSSGSAQIVSANGVNFHVRVGGAEGGHPVLCFPGALGTAATDFGPQLGPGGLGAAGRELTVVSFDPRGYGESRPPARDFPADFYERDAMDGLAIMDALGHREFSVLVRGSIAAPPCICVRSASIGAGGGCPVSG